MMGVGQSSLKLGLRLSRLDTVGVEDSDPRTPKAGLLGESGGVSENVEDGVGEYARADCHMKY